MRSDLHMRRSKRYTIWGREFILYFIFHRPYHLILNTRLPNNTKVTDCTIYGGITTFIFFFIERQRKDRQTLRVGNWFPWLSGLVGCVAILLCGKRDYFSVCVCAGIHRTCFLGVYIKQDLLQLEVQFKASLVGCTSHPFFIHFFNFSRSHPIWFIHGSIYNLGRFLFLSTYQRKKTTITSTTKQKANKIDVNVQTRHFVQANEIGIKVALCASTNLLLLTFCDPS